MTDASQARRAAAVAFFKDGWGLEPLDGGSRRDLSETSQVPADKWHEIIGNPTYADAILDRLAHNAYRIDLTGDSLRRIRPRSAIKD